MENSNHKLQILINWNRIEDLLLSGEATASAYKILAAENTITMELSDFENCVGSIRDELSRGLDTQHFASSMHEVSHGSIFPNFGDMPEESLIRLMRIREDRILRKLNNRFEFETILERAAKEDESVEELMPTRLEIHQNLWNLDSKFSDFASKVLVVGFCLIISIIGLISFHIIFQH